MAALARFTAIVSGGASGLGLSVARRIVSQGGRVLISDLNETGHAIAKELGPAACFAKADCTSEADVNAALDLAESTFAGTPINAVVNTAGIVHAAKTVSRKGEAYPLAVFERVLNVNVVGSFNVARLSAQRMAATAADEEGQRGVIINTASIAAFDGQAGQAAYSASKGAIVGLTLPMARDLAPLGIRVCTIAPGIFETPMSEWHTLLARTHGHCGPVGPHMLSRALPARAPAVAASPDKVRDSLCKAIPFPSRFGRPEEFAAYVEAILLNPYLNGEVTRLDGAVRMG